VISKPSKVEREVRLQIATLRAIFFLAQSLDSNAARLALVLDMFPELLRSERFRLRDELRDEVNWLRGEIGAIATDKTYRDLYDRIRDYPGYYYLDKLYVEGHLFKRYQVIFPRWPYMKDHAAVIFDGRVEKGLNQIFELEGQCLTDARSLLNNAYLAEKDIADFRKRAAEDQQKALMFSRASVLASMNFVEAYLHGIAYDCFHKFHDSLPIEDHDLLAEWDSVKKRRRFVDFNQKVFRYPAIVGRTRGVKVDLGACRAAHSLVGYAKDFRDALVHPSPFIDTKTGEQEKFAIQMGINSKIAQTVIEDAVSYAGVVERAIGNDPKLTAPWLFGELEAKAVGTKRKSTGSVSE
jgi:hypothetical protein